MSGWDLRNASMNGDLSLVRRYIEEGANINHRDSDGRTPIMCAVINNKSPVYQYLLSLPSTDCTVKSNDGYTVLHYALCICSTDTALVHALLSRMDRGSINTRDSSNMTALMDAVLYSNYGAIEAIGKHPLTTWDYQKLVRYTRYGTMLYMVL